MPQVYSKLFCDSDSKESACNAGNLSWIGKLGREDLLEKKWPLTPVFLPGEFHGQRSLVDYSTWGCKQLDMTEWLTLSLHLISERRNNFYIDLLSTYIVLYWFCHFVLSWVKEMSNFFFFFLRRLGSHFALCKRQCDLAVMCMFFSLLLFFSRKEQNAENWTEGYGRKNYQYERNNYVFSPILYESILDASTMRTLQ